MILVLFVLLLLGGVAEAQTVTRYTTSSARGAAGVACTVAARCTNQTAVGLSNGGDTISLEGNTSTATAYVYQGAADMIVPVNRTGTALAPITVVCESAAGVPAPGGCLLDGQFARVPIDLQAGNNYWRIQDLNVKNGSTRLIRSRGNFNEFRRIVGWDIAFPGVNGAAQFACDNPGTNNLFEDVAGFGIGTWTFTHSQDKAGACTFRRVWGRFEGTANGNNGGTPFGGLFYKAQATTCDNCLGEYRPNIGLTAYTVHLPPAQVPAECPLDTCTDGVPPTPNGAFNTNRWFDSIPGGCNVTSTATCQACAATVAERAGCVCIDNQALCNQDGFVGGSFFYVQSDANLSRMIVGTSSSGGALTFAGTGRLGGGMTFKDVLWWVDPAHALFTTVRALNVNERLFSPDNALTNVTTLSGAANVVDTVDSSVGGTSGVWVKTNTAELAATTTMAAGQASNPWTGTVGANLCYRYENRVRQDGTGGTVAQPLWPWPMNQRIIDATAVGVAGTYAGPCTGCVGAFPARASVDVTALVEGMLGTIPAACRNDAPPTPTFDDATGFAPATLSTF